MTTYYKAVRPDATSFYDPSFRWLPGDGTIPEGGWLVTHPDQGPMNEAAHYLSASVNPTDCTGMQWPCRLLEVEPIGEVAIPNPGALSNKRAAKSWRVVRELDPRLALGPNADRVLAVILRARHLNPAEMNRMTDAQEVAWGTAQGVAWNAAQEAARHTARGGGRTGGSTVCGTGRRRVCGKGSHTARRVW